MALADQLDRAEGEPGTPCSVGYALANLPETELALFKRILGTKERWGLTAAKVHGAMQAERSVVLGKARAATEAGDELEAIRLERLAAAYDVKLQTINRHRGETCRCFSAAA